MLRQAGGGLAVTDTVVMQSGSRAATDTEVVKASWRRPGCNRYSSYADRQSDATDTEVVKAGWMRPGCNRYSSYADRQSDRMQQIQKL